MSNPTLNRFEWLKAVMQQERLSPSAKNVATALAVQFANDETGQLNPSQETLADYLKVHRDTIKRVLRELRNAGWLMSTGDGGRGKSPLLRLLTPGKIIPFRPSKGGANHPAQAEKRGGDLQRKGGQIIPPLYNDKQSLEQKGRAKAGTAPATQPNPIVQRYQLHRFVGAATDGLRFVPKSDHHSLNQWSAWLSDAGLPTLNDLPIAIKAENGRETYFALPTKNPPTCDGGREEALQFFHDLVDLQAVQHAAQ